MSFTDQDLLGQALEDALEVLQHNSEGDFDYGTESYKNCPTYHHHPLQANASHLAETSTEKTVYSWRNAIRTSFDFTPFRVSLLRCHHFCKNPETDLYPDGAVYHSLQPIPKSQGVCITPVPQKGSKGRKKLRLFEYLHESLQNPDMANCIQWIDQPNGIFQFVSKNKEKLAELWGERKGNRKTMTYQKMARALRNYGRTGEIIKIRRKLTYQFGSVVLQRLSPTYVLGKDIDPYVQDDQECSYPSDWLSYHYYMYDKGHELQQPSSSTNPFCYSS